jgi:voltage-gated sodium channel
MVASPVFTTVIVTTIAVNAVVLGMLTYDSVDERFGRGLVITNAVCLGIFVVELCIRFSAYWPRPREFFRDGWNVFDLVVIGAALVPGVRENSTLLRIVRLLRLLRVVRLLPDLRVLLLGVWRSILPLVSIGAVTLMLLFVYGMAGWIFFGDQLPEQWGNIGRAMLTLFIMLTLEDFPRYMEEAMAVAPWAWIYFVSFILLAAFIVVNLLIAIVLNAMEEARELHRRHLLREEHGADEPPALDPEARAHILQRIAILRAALEDLEIELAVGDDEPRAEPQAGS